MPLVDSLLTLFKVDSQVRGLRTRLQSAERYLAAQNKLLNDLLQDQQELSTRRKHLQATIANQDVEVKGIDERIEKLRGELNNAATNKQYTALLTELNTVKAGRSHIEDKMLQDMEQVEKLQQQFEALEGQIADRTKVRDLAKAQLEERHNDVGQRLSELEKERAEAAAVIPAASLAVFEEVADKHEGEAMSVVVEIDRRSRDYSCDACNMHLPFEQVSLLMARTEALVRCPSCGRILYMQEETRGSLAKK